MGLFDFLRKPSSETTSVEDRRDALKREREIEFRIQVLERRRDRLKDRP